MNTARKKTAAIIIITVTVAISAIIVTAGFAVSAKKDSPHGCVLKAYENTVALYVDGEIKEVYSEIVLDTLPKQDIDQLEAGIAFDNCDEARNAIEDYDG